MRTHQEFSDAPYGDAELSPILHLSAAEIPHDPAAFLCIADVKTTGG